MMDAAEKLGDLAPERLLSYEDRDKTIEVLGDGIADGVAEIPTVAAEYRACHPHLVAPAGGVTLALTTRTAYSLDTAAVICQALLRRRVLPEAIASDAEMAFHEAVNNAMLHGNLAVSNGPITAPGQMQAFFTMVRERLADDHHALRRVLLSAAWDEAEVQLFVLDEGQGFDPAKVLLMSDEAKSGRGLEIMSQLARTVAVSHGGRGLTLAFPR